MRVGGAVLVVLALVAGCASSSDAIARGQRYYEDNQYERALAIWRDLERRDAMLEPHDRVRYAYLRGMTDFRLGFRDDARHWLAIAKASREQAPESLAPSWSERLDAALEDLARGVTNRSSRDVVQTIAAPSAEPPSQTPALDAGPFALPTGAAPVQP